MCNFLLQIDKVFRKVVNLLSHRWPVNPKSHIHTKVLPAGWQRPLLKHGLG